MKIKIRILVPKMYISNLFMKIMLKKSKKDRKGKSHRYETTEIDILNMLKS